MRSIRLLILPLALALLIPASTAEEQRPCSAAEHRQFDFWIGVWDVRTPDGVTEPASGPSAREIPAAESPYGPQESAH